MNDTTIPVEVNPLAFLKAIFQKPDEEFICGSQVYYGPGDEDDHRYLLIRHRFHSYWYLCGCFKRRTAELGPLIKEAVWRVPDRESVFPNANSQQVCSRLSDLLFEGALQDVVDAQNGVVDRSRLVTPASTRQTRVDTFVNGLQAASNPATQIKAMSTLTKCVQQQVIVKQVRIIRKLSQKSVRDDAIINRIDNDKTAIEVLQMFRGDLSRKAFVDRLLKSNEASESSGLFPRNRSGMLGELSESNQANVVHIMTDIAIKVSKLLLPKDAEAGAATLLRRMTGNPKFQQFALPSSDESLSSYEEWTINPVVNSIKTALEKLGMKDQMLREQLLSLLSGYPKSWLQNHLGVGRVSITNAQDHTAAVGAPR